MSSVPFSKRHIGPSSAGITAMLEALGFASMSDFLDRVVPSGIRLKKPLDLPDARSEESALEELARIVSRNIPLSSYIGMGYSDCHMPAVIRRNIFENPGWYTAYTPYQAEIAQGRLEALLNFQTMVADLTGMDIANASLLDEATAVAEAVAMAQGIRGGDAIFVADDIHPQTLEVLQTRMEPLGVRIHTGPVHAEPSEAVFARIVQYPATDGIIHNLEPIIERAHAGGSLAIVAADLLALVLVKPPGECGADIVVGSSQRFGVPMGYGGPHAAFLAARDEHKRRMPGRLVGVSKDAEGRRAFRLTLQTREQHIRRDRATSNICTAQVLLAVLASMYAVYHGPEGLQTIARKIHGLANQLSEALTRKGFAVHPGPFFDTVRVWLGESTADEILVAAEERGMLFRRIDDHVVCVALDETTESIDEIVSVFGASAYDVPDSTTVEMPAAIARTSEILTHPVFRTYHTETAMQRYIRRLESRDLSLTHAMIPLGSCTMKLNAASEMLPVSWPSVGAMHPFAPREHAAGFKELAGQLSSWLGEITGLPAVSLQPNAGSQGEFAGLLAIRAYHHSRGDTQRNVCLIPHSAHGTNPASAVMAGFKVVAVACGPDGDIDTADLAARIASHPDRIAALMVTYPSTHGVFEEGIGEVCRLVHEAGGQVYMDGANMNAQLGICRPGDIGADVCHLNLHKTFCIPHGGGGPGVGPICAAPHLAEFLPGIHGGNSAVGPVAAAPMGSASILVISWMYIAMMGPSGLAHASEVAILSANYIARRLDEAFPVLYRGKGGFVAHECILDVRDWKARAGIEVEDIAKRLIDYGFHAPTMSWPVPGTLMVEPTESEPKSELDRFCDAMLAIRKELDAIASGEASPANNPLKNAPHTARAVTADEWPHPYSRATAAFPDQRLREFKFWPSVARVDNVHGDRNVFCSCPPLEDVAT
jgi:glycine dehydrogenase